VHTRAAFATKVRGLRAKLYNKTRYAEKATMKKTIAMHDERDNKHKNALTVQKGAVPAYLMDRENVSRAKVLSNTVKQKRKEKAGKYSVPIPKVKPITEAEMFKVMRTGKRKSKMWKVSPPCTCACNLLALERAPRRCACFERILTRASPLSIVFVFSSA
jgi:ribosome biogenesis protein NSA2